MCKQCIILPSTTTTASTSTTAGTTTTRPTTAGRRRARRTDAAAKRGVHVLGEHAVVHDGTAVPAGVVALVDQGLADQVLEAVAPDLFHFEGDGITATLSIAVRSDLLQDHGLHPDHFCFCEAVRTDVPLPGGVDDDGGIAHQRRVDVHGRDPVEGYGLLIAAEETRHFQGDPLLVDDDL